MVAPLASLPKRSAAATRHRVTYTLNLRQKFIGEAYVVSLLALVSL